MTAPTNIPHEKKTLRELRLERDYWERQITEATHWGAALAAANDFRRQCEEWITLRMHEGEVA